MEKNSKEWHTYSIVCAKQEPNNTDGNDQVIRHGSMFRNVILEHSEVY